VGETRQPCHDPGQLGVVGDALEVVARRVRNLQLCDLVGGQFDVEGSDSVVDVRGLDPADVLLLMGFL
jgi:hypothetical protein